MKKIDNDRLFICFPAANIYVKYSFAVAECMSKLFQFEIQIGTAFFHCKRHIFFSRPFMPPAKEFS